MRKAVVMICLLSFCLWTITNGQIIDIDSFLDKDAMVNPKILSEKWTLLESRLMSLVRDSTKVLLSRGIEAASSLNISTGCIRDVFKVSQGLKKLKVWAFKFLDASSKSIDGFLDYTVGSLGDYDECVNNAVYDERPGKQERKVLFRGKYCRISFKTYLPPKPKKIKLQPLNALRNFTVKDTIIGFAATRAYMTYYRTFNIAACVPSSCSEKDVHEVLKKVFNYLGLYSREPTCQVKNEAKFTPDIMFVIGLYCFTGFVVLIGTGIDIYARYRKTTFKSIGVRIFTSFSLISNFRNLINTSVASDAFTCLYGIKALTMLWIIGGHTSSHLLFLGHKINKAMDLIQSFYFQPVMNSNVSVDTFIFISGMLLCYHFIKITRAVKRPFSFTIYILHRIVRVFPAYCYSIAFVFLMPLMGSGPEFPTMVSYYVEMCKKTWWTNVLFINNFCNTEHLCFPESWYLAVDMQLYVAGLIILLPLVRWPKIGTMMAVVTIVASMASSWLSVYMGDLLPFHIRSFDFNLLKDTHVYFYIMPYVHAGPYCVGILCGYFLEKRKELHIPKAVEFIGWCVCLVTCLSILYGVQKWNAGAEPGFLEVLFYTSCNRVAWSLSMAWIVICCKTGHGGLANYILSWKMWIPLSRLSLFAYLIHPILMKLYFGAIKTELPAGLHTGVWLYLGNVVLTYIFATGASLLIEAPFLSLEKIVLRKEMNQNSKKEINEFQNDSTVSSRYVMPYVLTEAVRNQESCTVPENIVNLHKTQC